jgi:hypothetical protein
MLAPRVGVGLSTAITARQVSLVKIRATCISPIRGRSKSCPVAVGVVRSEAVQIAKAVVREVRGFRAEQDVDELAWEARGRRKRVSSGCFRA